MLDSHRIISAATESVLLNMPKRPASKQKNAAQRKTNKKDAAPSVLKGWDQISGFLGEPPSVVQRWASEGMPVRKQGRYVETTPDELNAWLGKESGKPIHTVTADTDLTEELKRGLSYLRHEKKPSK